MNKIFLAAALFASPATALAWEWTLIGAPAGDSVKTVSASPYLALNLGCGAKIYLAEKLPPHSDMSDKGLNYTFYYENLRDNPAYLAHVMRTIDPSIVFTLSEQERNAAFAKTPLTFKNSSELSESGKKLYQLVKRLRISPEKKSAVQKALKEVNLPDDVRGMRRALGRMVADQGVERSKGPGQTSVLTLKDPNQQKVLLQHALRATMIWDLYYMSKPRSEETQERRIRLLDAQRMTTMTMNPLLETEFTLGMALDKFEIFNSELNENGCEAAP